MMMMHYVYWKQQTALFLFLLFCLFQAWESQMWKHLWFFLQNHFYQDLPLPTWQRIFMVEPITFWKWVWYPFGFYSHVLLKIIIIQTRSIYIFWFPIYRWTFTLKMLNHFWGAFLVTRPPTLMQTPLLKVKNMHSPKRQRGQEEKQMMVIGEKKKRVYPTSTVIWTRPGPWWGRRKGLRQWAL